MLDASAACCVPTADAPRRLAALARADRAANAAALAKFDASIAEAKESHGEVEVADRSRDKAEYYARIGDKAAALAAFDAIPEKALSTGQKIDGVMAKARLGLFHGDAALTKASLAAAVTMNESGGDWDRRNRLKIYQGAVAMGDRDFKRAAELYLDSIATFTATEMFPYKQFIFYTVLMTLKVRWCVVLVVVVGRVFGVCACVVFTSLERYDVCMRGGAGRDRTCIACIFAPRLAFTRLERRCCTHARARARRPRSESSPAIWLVHWQHPVRGMINITKSESITRRRRTCGADDQ
jgi:hypothetical protein